MALSAPVRKYWPEFATTGKAEVTVVELLSPRAGLSSLDPDSGIGVTELTEGVGVRDDTGSLRAGGRGSPVLCAALV
ncbi:serine hydrolase [Nocardia terpenica]|uniref:serine hydrolase n=1 Tax=Nocardia terpenica TaxID=455432 RepID=UPI0012E937B0|nr:serine hydrolase [Nocardia terpenica]NQE90079.1 serine hydrolase [Nocardia terpenica]